jgi:hypothetical protein
MRFLRSFTKTAIWLVAAGCLLVPKPLAACSVPVFRYALERWPADPFPIFIFYKGELSDDDRALLAKLDDSTSQRPSTANVAIHLIDLESDEIDEFSRKLWSEQQTEQLPWMAVRSPKGSPAETTVWSGPLTEPNAVALVDSPVRRELTQRILKGDSAVWLFLESGDAEQDDAAAALLQSQIDRLALELKLPDAEAPSPASAPETEEPALSSSAELAVAFSMIRLSRDDPQEAVLVSMLLESEGDLREFDDKPLAFPVFGRGRVLYALVGAGINENTIHEACEFLIGPCSCQVKDENPGSDLLLRVNWDDQIEESIGHDRELPPLAGLDEFVEMAKASDANPASVADASTAQPTASAAPPANGSAARDTAGAGGSEAAPGVLSRNVLIVSLLGIALVVGGTLFVMRKT